MQPQNMEPEAPASNGTSRAVRAAAALCVAGDPEEGLISPSVFTHSLVLKAAAILTAAGSVGGILSILWGAGLVGVEVKDFLVGAIYTLTLGGALYLSGTLTAKRAALIAATVVVFQAWNTVFYHTPQIASLVIILGLWLPAYWVVTRPADMAALGLDAKSLGAKFAWGLIVGLALSSYMAWAMKNYGFSFKIQPWRLILNSAQVFPMYLMVFCLFFLVWNKLKSWGATPAQLIAGLAVMSAALNAPSFFCVTISTNTGAATGISGFFAVTVIMVLSTQLTFWRLRSAIPAACLFTAMADLLIITGLS
jgi:hypothetical protein